MAQKFLIFRHLFTVCVHESTDHFVEFLRLVEVQPRYFEVVLALEMSNFYLLGDRKRLINKVIDILLYIGMTEPLRDHSTGQLSLQSSKHPNIVI